MFFKNINMNMYLCSVGQRIQLTNDMVSNGTYAHRDTNISYTNSLGQIVSWLCSHGIVCADMEDLRNLFTNFDGGNLSKMLKILILIHNIFNARFHWL